MNEECFTLERQLKEQQDLELSLLEKNAHSDFHPSYPHPKANSPNLVANDAEDPLNSKVPSLGSQVAQTKKPNRQKARMARRAAEQEAAAEQAAKEAENIPNLREQECESMRREYTLRNLVEKEIRSDGHCLYAAIADQLEDSEIGLEPRIEMNIPDYKEQITNSGYKVTRRVAATLMSQTPDDFLPFLEEPIEDYTRKIRETGEWGGHLELMALAKAYKVDINVLQSNGKVERIECGSGDSNNALWLAYYHHSFGLGEHYNSLRQLK